MTVESNATKPRIRCAAYTRKSTEEGLEQEFNSLDAQREACEAYIASQRHEGWVCLPDRYDDGGYSGGSMERPALQRLLKDIASGKIDVCVVYKVDRLSRSLLDFAKIIGLFEQHGVAFTSITQSFNTNTSIGRLTLNMLLSFSQFEREIIGERIRDKVAAAKRKGKFTGGTPPLGYDVCIIKHRLVVNKKEAETVRFIFKRFVETASGLTIARELNAKGITTKSWTTKKGVVRQGKKWNASHIYRTLANRTYLGEIKHKDAAYPGEHDAIISHQLWDRVHNILASHNRKDQRGVSKVPSLLRGIIRCGYCEKAMTNAFTTRKNRVYRYYVCTHAAKNGYDICPVKRVSAGIIEEAVLGQLRATFKSPEMIAQTFIAAQTMEQERIGLLTAEKSRLDRQARELKRKMSELVLSGDPAFAESPEYTRLSDEFNSLEENHRTIIAELESLESQSLTERDVADTLQRIDTIWNHLFPHEQRRIVQLLVHKVTVNVGSIDVSIRANGLHSLISEANGTMENHSERS